MKTLNFPRIPLTVGALSILLCGCQADAPNTKSTTVDAASEVPAVIVAEAVQTDAIEPAETALQEPDVATPPATAGIFDLLPVVPADMSPDVAEVVKLAHSGVSEEVQLAFVEASRTTTQPTADEIVYLQDVGVSAEIVSAMIRRSSENTDAALAASEAYEPVPGFTEPVFDVSAPASVEVQTATSPPSSPVIASAPERVTMFYDELSPYGRWIEIDGYGWCWKPSVAVVDINWQPYRDRGRWLHSDHGWYWQSDYRWGWAAFHYGRWFADPIYGWCWYPDTVWGPSWVTWRTSGTYVGWAPLPPYSYYRPGVGFIYRDRHVSFSFGFGLSYSSYSWCGYRNLCRSNVYRYCEPRNRYRHHHHNSTVVNNYVTGDNNVIINNGVHIDRVNVASGEQVKRVNVRRGDGSHGRPDHVYTRGEESVVLAQTISSKPSERVASVSRKTTSGRGASVDSRTAVIGSPSDARKTSVAQSRSTATSTRSSIKTPSSTRPAGSSNNSRVSSAATTSSPSTTVRKTTTQQRSPAVVTSRASTSGRTAARETRSATTYNARPSNQSESKAVQSRTFSRTATQSRTISSVPTRRTTTPTSSRVTSTSTRQPSPVIISPSGASSNSRFPKPNIIGPNSRNYRSSATSSRSSVRSLPSASRSSSVRTTPSSSSRSTPQRVTSSPTPSPRISSTPSSRSSIKSTQPRGVSRSSVQTRRATQPSSRATGAATQRKSVQTRSR